MSEPLLYFDSYASPIGRLHFYFDTQQRLYSLVLMQAAPGTKEHNLQEGDGSFLKKQLDRYFEGKLQSFKLKLKPPGTPFQQTVWQALRQVPYATTLSYKQVACRIGQPEACRAVGNAVGANRILICIPCHRIIKSSGLPGGFSAGIENKKYLQNWKGSGNHLS